MAKNEKTDQTNVPFKRATAGGSNGSRSDAEDQADEAKHEKTTCGDSQAREKAEKAKRQDGRRRSDEKRVVLASLQRAIPRSVPHRYVRSSPKPGWTANLLVVHQPNLKFARRDRALL